MIPGCTTALDFELDDHEVNLNNATDIYVTVEQGDTTIVVSGDRVEPDGYRLTAYLTQSETLRLRDDMSATVQVNWIYTNIAGATQRAATDPATIDVGRQTLRRVLP